MKLAMPSWDGAVFLHIDVQTAFAARHSQTQDYLATAARIDGLCARVRAAGVPVVGVVMDLKGAGPQKMPADAMVRDWYLKESDSDRFGQLVQPGAYDAYLAKTGMSAGRGAVAATFFHEVFSAHAARYHVVVTGSYAAECVLQSVYELSRQHPDRIFWVVDDLCIPSHERNRLSHDSFNDFPNVHLIDTGLLPAPVARPKRKRAAQKQPLLIS